ncbi:MAG: SpoIID/LytB domain-containing protein [Clostridiales Family XIII bacterium]|nr:SpoIID/LytB domain-containing protein [Clostridiales Family XIII bacterium]
MNRFFVCVLSIVVAFCAFSPAPAAYADMAWEDFMPNEFIKVGLAYGSGAPASCEIYSDNGFILGFEDDGGIMEAFHLRDYTTITVKLSGRYATALSGDTLISDDLGVSGYILPYDYKDGGSIRFGGASYRGGLSFRPNPNNTITVVNLLPLEHYLYGVLNSEMGRQNPGEALKAQAVVSRSYAIHSFGDHAADGFDVCSGVHCQVYKGSSAEYSETSRAADETAGLIMYSGGKVASGNFFKNSGGHTQNSEDVWNDRVSHLRGVNDEFSPDYPWSWSVSASRLGDTLAAGNMGCGDISSVTVSGRSANGYVSELTVRGSQGSVVLKKEQIRSILGASNVKSLNFTLSSGSGTGGAVVSKPGGNAAGASRHALGSSGAKALSGKIYAVSAPSGGGEAVSAVSIGPSTAVLAASGTTQGAMQGTAQGVLQGGASGTSQGGAGTGDSPATGGTIVFTGSGFGHGVGLPQDSAIEMAKQGYSYMEILNKYYTGISISRREG